MISAAGSQCRTERKHSSRDVRIANRDLERPNFESGEGKAMYPRGGGGYLPGLVQILRFLRVQVRNLSYDSTPLGETCGKFCSPARISSPILGMTSFCAPRDLVGFPELLS